MIKIELQFTTVAEAVAFLAAGQAATGAAAAVVTEKPPKPEKPAKVAADPTPATTPVATPAATSPTAAVVVADAPAVKAIDYAVDVSPKIALAAKKDRAAVVAALGKAGVAKGTELKPEQWADFAAAMDAILAG